MIPTKPKTGGFESIEGRYANDDINKVTKIQDVKTSLVNDV